MEYGLIKKITSYFNNFIQQRKVERTSINYWNAGLTFVEYIDDSEDFSLSPEFVVWKETEREYANLGMKTISYDSFYSYSYTSEEMLKEYKKISLAVRSNDPILHAEIFEKKYINKERNIATYELTTVN